jgi:ABC-type phosphate transport system auxiliary subunit
MDSNIQDSMRVLEAKSERLDAQMGVIRRDLSSLRQQLVRLIVMCNDMNYELERRNNAKVQKTEDMGGRS